MGDWDRGYAVGWSGLPMLIGCSAVWESGWRWGVHYRGVAHARDRARSGAIPYMREVA